MSHPLFSVVIPTYNRDALVAATLDSVFAQQCTDYEVIVVDDGSTDGTLERVAAFGDRVRMLRQDHRGCAAARNLGAREARGEYLAFLDSDDLWFSWTLRVFAETIETWNRPAIVAGKLYPFVDEAEISYVRETALVNVGGPDFLSTALKEGFALGVAHTVTRRDAYLAVGGCLEEDINGTDSDVLLKMGTAQGFAIVKQPATLAYRQHAGGTTMNLDKGFAGALLMLQNERTGAYPGGANRRDERLEQILMRVRAISRICLFGGRSDLAWKLYRETFRDNLRLLRIRYLLGLPALAMRAKFHAPGP
jgi:hypothetical protein